ncbi:hypothetical protein [Halarcobacter ebronensis]|nr:hypothetical protein [Halarcobacter ebronensis]
MSDYTEPRGIRNNNPMNIRKSSNDWQGKIVGEDTAFETFVSPAYGIRAGAKTLLNYQKFYGLNTVNQIISRFAPASENNTNAYATHVADYLGVGLNEPITVKDRIYDLVTVIILHENGYNPYDTQVINSGVSLALA